RPGARQRALRGGRRCGAGRAPPRRPRSPARARARRSRPARTPARADARAPPARRHARDRGPRARGRRPRRSAALIAGALGWGAAAGAMAWVGYAWLPHLVTPLCAWRGGRSGRRAVLRRHRQRCVFWSIQPEGLRPAPAEAQVAHVLRRAHPGAIVDLHDAEGTPGAPARLCAALPAMIDGLAAAGYGFATVGELLAAS